MSKPRVAILGLGIMGGGMARRALGAGFPLAVYNRSADKAQALQSEGATIAATPREAARDADVVIAMLADDVASRATWLGDNGALAGAKPGAVLVDASTLSVKWIRELATQASQKGCELLDAPVTGTKPHAAAGELNFLVGGSEAALNKATPVLQVMSKSIVHLGPSGSGALMKLINNFVCGVQVAALAEGVALIERTELNAEQAVGVLTGGAPGSPLVKMLAARMLARDFTPNFYLRLLAKDLSYAIEEGDARHLNLTTARTALQMLQRADDVGLGEQDMSAVVEMLRRA